MGDIKIYNYDHTPISFQIGEGNLMINATEMAKSFGKRVQHFLDTEQTKSFMQTLSQSRNLGFESIVCITKGGQNAGTWMHEDLAVVFAQWLSPGFYLWCNDRIKELLQTGSTQSDRRLGAAMRVVPRNKVKVTDRNIELLRSLAYLEEGACRPFHCDNVLDRILADYAHNNIGKVEEAYQSYRKSLTYPTATEK